METDSSLAYSIWSIKRKDDMKALFVSEGITRWIMGTKLQAKTNNLEITKFVIQ